MKIALQACLLILVSTHLSGCCFESGAPGSVAVPALSYYSRQMDKININISTCDANNSSKCPQKIFATFNIPRGYVLSALPYTRKSYCRLPKETFVRRITFAISTKDGGPLSRSEHRYVTNTESRYDVNILAITPTGRSSEVMAKIYSKAGFDGKKFDNYKYGLKSFNDRYYYGDAGAGIQKIYCAATFKKASKGHYCKYTATFVDGLTIRARFVDFRLNGGLDFARKRMTFIKSILCRHLDCSKSYVKAKIVK